MRKLDWTILSIVFVGGLARFWGINFGLPHTLCRPDESIITGIAFGFFSGDFNPHFFSYPTLYIYVIHGLYFLYYSIGKLLGHYSSVSDVIENYIAYPTNFFLISRCLSALIGTSTVVIVYNIAKKLFDRKTAILSAFFLSLTYLHVRDSHFGVTDVSMTFMIMFSLLYILESYQKKDTKYYIFAGIIAGLAISTKYNAILLVIPMLIAHLLNTWAFINKKRNYNSLINNKRKYHFIIILGIILITIGCLFTIEFVETYLSPYGKLSNPTSIMFVEFIRVALILTGLTMMFSKVIYREVNNFYVKNKENSKKLFTDKLIFFVYIFFDKRILLFGISLIVFFLIGTPFSILDFGSFYKGFISQVDHLQSGHGMDLGIGWFYHAKHTLPKGLGLPLFMAALGGSIILLISDTKKFAILLSFPVIYYVAIGKGHTVFLRYLIPVIPFACIVGAKFAVSVSIRAAKYFRWNASEKMIRMLLVISIIFPSAFRIIQFDRLLAKRDNRLIATDWVFDNIPSGSSILQVGNSYGNLQLPHYKEYLDKLETVYKSLVASGAKPGRALLIKAKIEYLKKTIKIKGYRQFKGLDNQKRYSILMSALPQYVILQDDPTKKNTHVRPEWLSNALKTSYVLKKSFEAIKIENNDNWFDQIDNFFLPFSGFKDIERPGPNIIIYQNKNL